MYLFNDNSYLVDQRLEGLSDFALILVIFNLKFSINIRTNLREN